MFNEKRKQALEQMALRFASEALAALDEDQFKSRRRDMLKALKELRNDFNSSRLWMERTIREVRLDGKDEEIQALEARIAKECLKAAIDIETGDRSRLKVIRELDQRLEGLINDC